MPPKFKKMSVHVKRMQSARIKTSADFLQSQEERTELTGVLREILKTRDGSQLVSWPELVYNEVVRTGKPVLDKGEDPDKSVATYKSERLTELCRDLRANDYSTRL